MDKRTIIAFVLIGIILLIMRTDLYRDIVMPDQKVITSDSFQDSTKIDVSSEDLNKQQKEVVGDQDKTAIVKSNSFDKSRQIILSSKKDVVKEDVVVETDLYSAKINSLGAVVSSWALKNYKYDGEEQVQLIKNEGHGNLGLYFIIDEDTLFTYDAVFEPDKNNISFDNQSEDSVKFSLDLGDGRQIIKTYKFYKDQYVVDLTVEMKKIPVEFDNHQYFIGWKSGLNYTELDYSNLIDKEDIGNAKAYIYQGGSKEELSLPNKPNEQKTRSDFSGVVDWAAVRTKYFAMVILPDKQFDIEPILYGRTYSIYDDPNLKDRVEKEYSVTLKTNIPPSKLDNVTHTFRVYIGPLDYSIIKNYHPTLAKIMDFGMSIIRPFAKLVLYSFLFIHDFIPNYGIVLIVFSILIKILVSPLTRKSFVSMQKMQSLQPKMNELKEKYAKDPKRLNTETMKLYKEEGINPMSGCLPTLLQLPLLWAVFIIFRNTIELRGAEFVWWINDLSAPDTIFQLPFSIPFYGNLVNILPIVMGVSMFIQQKMTMKDPKQKAMVYFMPIFFTLLFNTFPSGLNLYYTLFNFFTILQQKFTPEKKIDTGFSAAPKQVQESNKNIKGKSPKKK
ncbi:MAG: membrane protein insertase YidC [Candidatus Zhuqueibacterota bacterium]